MSKNMEEYEIVFFDLDTTGFSKDDQIIQIAACYEESLFNVYITPTRPIHWKASQVTKFQLCDGHLYLRNNRVRTSSPKNAFNNFMNYLKAIKKKIILVAHNCFGFDMPRIIKLAGELNLLEQFQEIVHGFSDSLVILKDFMKPPGGRGKFSLKFLVQTTFHKKAKYLNNAKRKVKALQLLLSEDGQDISKEAILSWTKSFDQYFRQQQMKMLSTKAKSSLQCYRNSLPTWIINKMAKTRINRAMLRDIFQKHGFEGIQRLFSKNYYGKPRVTRSIKIISNTCDTIHNDLSGNLQKHKSFLYF